jgi:diketogulonate reductase-like aldo/keto reductase
MDATATVRLHTNRSMPVIGLGTWQLTDDTAVTIEEAVALGYRMIDTSGDYGTQPAIGQAIDRAPIDRAELYLVTKVEEDEDSYDATERNLSQLGIDHADLMLIHRPPAEGAGVELWDRLIRARKDGLTRDIGVSNYTEAQIDELADATGELPVVNQIEWSPFGWSEEMLAYCREDGVVIQAYSPLTRTSRLHDERIVGIAKRHRKTPAQVLLRWNIELGVVPLPKANRRDHLVENLDVFDFELDDEDMRELGNLNERYSTLGSLPYA